MDDQSIADHVIFKMFKLASNIEIFVQLLICFLLIFSITDKANYVNAQVAD